MESFSNKSNVPSQHRSRCLLRNCVELCVVAGLSYTPGILPGTTIRYKVLQVQLEDVVSVCKGIDSCIGLNVIKLNMSILE
jgi:hypothetical protein